ncbi:MAG: hypothetical protein HKN68_03840 [Saprospiraceae bacterium]|nr:hypothetical protein [Saprospiraceae bacterium]
MSRKIGPRLLRVTLITLVVYLIYINYIRDSTPTNNITFELSILPEYESMKVGIRGNTEPLSWTKSIHLSREGTNYKTRIEFPQANEEVRFKFVIEQPGKALELESIEYRSLNLKASNNDVMSFRWNQE